MSFRKFVSKSLEQLSLGLREYIHILNGQLCPKGAEECAKYAANVVEKIKEDYVEGYWKQTLLRFIGKVLPEQREVLKALNDILKKYRLKFY